MQVTSNVTGVANDPIDPVARERQRIGGVIVSLRDEHDVRQEAFAHLAGIGWSTLQRMEYGTTGVGIDSYIKVAFAFGVPLARLFDDTESHTRGGATGVATPGEQGGDS